LYDHLPGILAGYPAVLFTILALLSLPKEFVEPKIVEQPAVMVESADVADAEAESSSVDADAPKTKVVIADDPWWVVNPHMLFWIGLSVMIVWYIAFRFNMPKNKFLLLFGLLGTFIGIPVVLEITGYIRPFTIVATWLGYLAPEVNAGGFFVLSMVFSVIWLGNFVYSRTHMKVVLDESGLTINRLGGKGERFELIGLKTENEPLDYLELFLAGVGSLSLKTRMNKEIFKMDRVVGLYRFPFFPFTKGKLDRIEELLSYQGKVVSVEAQEIADAAEQMEAESEESVAAGGEEGGDSESSSSSDAKQIR
ncbi:MAG: hypothetical protein AAGA30_16885, partial [Planctomycetota bacterium]